MEFYGDKGNEKFGNVQKYFLYLNMFCTFVKLINAQWI